MGNPMFKVLTLNNIAVEGLRHFSREHYEVASEIAHPDAILLRSYNMHDMEIPETLAAVGRAGAGGLQARENHGEYDWYRVGCSLGADHHAPNRTCYR